MVKGSSLPPLKDNQGKYGLVALLVLLTAFGLWFAFGTGEEPKQEPPPAPEPEPVVREQFEPQIEIPDEEELFEEPAEPVEAAPKRPARPQYVECNGVLSAKEILGTINGPPRRQVRSCYERRLKDDNLLQGNIPLTEADKKKLRQHKAFLKILGDVKVSLSTKREALCRKGSVVSLILLAAEPRLKLFL